MVYFTPFSAGMRNFSIPDSEASGERSASTEKAHGTFFA